MKFFLLLCLLSHLQCPLLLRRPDLLPSLRRMGGRNVPVVGRRSCGKMGRVCFARFAARRQDVVRMNRGVKNMEEKIDCVPPSALEKKSSWPLTVAKTSCV